MFGASPSDGSSNIISFGLDMSARPIASICCSPPDSVPATWLRRSASRGNCVEHPVAVCGDAVAVAPQIGAHVEVLLDRHVGKHAPPFGAMGDAARQDFAARSTA